MEIPELFHSYAHDSEQGKVVCVTSYDLTWTAKGWKGTVSFRSLQDGTSDTVAFGSFIVCYRKLHPKHTPVWLSNGVAFHSSVDVEVPPCDR